MMCTVRMSWAGLIGLGLAQQESAGGAMLLTGVGVGLLKSTNKSAMLLHGSRGSWAKCLPALSGCYGCGL